MQRFRPFLTSLLLGVLLMPAAAFGQSPLRLKVEVPFRFVVGKQSFAAGQYYIVRVAPNTLALRDSDYQFLGFFTAATLQFSSRHHSTVVAFAREGERRVLTQVWEEGTQYGYELSPPKPAGSRARAPAAGQQTLSAISTR